MTEQSPPAVAIRVLLMATPSPRVSAVKDILTCQSDIELLEIPESRGVELLAMLRRTEPDVLAVELDPGDVLPLCDQVLNENPHLTLLAITPAPSEITLHRLKVQCRTLMSSSIERLPEELRELIEL